MALPLEQEIEYPTSDGQPMAETTLHRKVMSNTIGGLERRYADVADVWVGGNLLLYYQKGNPKKCVAPDVLLARGVAKWDRRIYLLWEEKPPTLIFEITSKNDPQRGHRISRRTSMSGSAWRSSSSSIPTGST